MSREGGTGTKRSVAIGTVQKKTKKLGVVAVGRLARAILWENEVDSQMLARGAGQWWPSSHPGPLAAEETCPGQLG